jgi:cobalt-zinc-cadmium efflux system outer membrane protein
MQPFVFARAAIVCCAMLGVACGAAGRDAYVPQHADIDRVAPRDAASEHALEGAVLERDAFVESVLARNPSIESARQAWRAAKARVRQAGAFEDPMVDVGIAPLSIGSSSARFGWQAGISQKLPWFGKRSAEAAIGAAEAHAAESDVEAVRRDLALTATLLYDDYYVAARALEINAQHVELVRSLRAAATAQMEVGRGGLQDTLRAEAELTHLEHDGVILASNRDITIAQMNELLHREPSASLPPPPSDLVVRDPDLLDAKRLESEAVERRPELAAAKRRAEAEQARADRATRERWPDVTVSTSYNTMWDMPEHRWMVGLGLNIPIQTGRRDAAVDEANAARARFESDAARIVDATRTEVAVALKRLEEVRHVIRLYETRLLPVAKSEIEAARAAFITSQTSFVAVMEAERNLRNVELEYQMMRADHDRRVAQLERALGRIAGAKR